MRSFTRSSPKATAPARPRPSKKWFDSMPREYFSIARSASLHAVRAGARIHVIGVCGVAMAQMACALAEAGYRVSGSDKDFYEPMGSLLKTSRVELLRGFRAENVPLDAELVVIGNVVSYGHPEVEVVERRQLPYTLFPRLLFELLIEGRHSCVVSGTHGKTTTSAMLAHVLCRAGLAPGYFIGGASRNFSRSLLPGTGGFSVVEGDEYDSAFFAKVPKFSFYRPRTLIVTSVEYDHADIYPSLEKINEEFTRLVLSVPGNGWAICCTAGSNLAGLVQEWRGKSSCRIVTYGFSAEADYRIAVHSCRGLSQTVRLEFEGSNTVEFQLPLAGEYNALNAAAVLAAAHSCGVAPARSAEFLSDFQGVKRRQEIRCDCGGVTLIEDFAHHPTAVRETLKAVREAFPGRRLLAAFEPRSNTSRRKVFQQDYVQAFSAADVVLLCDVPLRDGEAREQLLDVSVLAREIGGAGPLCAVLPDAAAIERHLLDGLKSGDVVIVMSNGSFGGLIEKLMNSLSARS